MTEILYKELSFAIIGAAMEVHAQALHYPAATGLQLAILINLGMSSLEYRRVIKSENKSSR